MVPLFFYAADGLKLKAILKMPGAILVEFGRLKIQLKCFLDLSLTILKGKHVPGLLPEPNGGTAILV